MKKRMIALLLALTICLSMLAGCGVQPVDKTTGADTSQTTAGADTSQTTAGADTATEANKEPVKLTIWVKEDLRVEDWETNAQTLWLEEQGNFDLEFQVLSSADYDTKMNMALTVGKVEELPDIILGKFSNSSVWEYAQAETIVPLTEYYDNPELAVNINEQIVNCGVDYIKQIVCPDGNIYGVPYFNQSFLNEYPDKIWIYKPWLDALGEDIPTTTEEFYQVLKKVKETDLNGNGKHDEIPMAGDTSDNYNRYIRALMNAFVYAGGLNYTLTDDNGTLTAAFSTEEWKDGLEYIAKLFDEQLILAESLTMTTDQLTAMLASEEQMVFSHVYFTASACAHVDDYICIDALKGPEGVQWATYEETSAKVAYLVTANCKDPEAAFRLGDLLSSEKLGISQRWGLEGEDWDYVKNSKVDISGLVSSVAGWDGFFISYNGDADYWHLQLQNDAWRQTGPYVRHYGIANGLLIDPSTQKPATLVLNEAGNLYQSAARHPKNDPSVLNFTSDEEEQIADIETALLKYVDEFKANVFAGNIDLDKEWDNYLAELERIGLDTWLEVYQGAYDRMYK